MRQIDIPGVDTKFIEQRTGILLELLERILPKTVGQSFEQRYGLCTKPTLVRFRILDRRLYVNGFSDISVTTEQFRYFSCNASRIFITENEINFLSMPDMPNSMVIFGGGKGVPILKAIDWLREKEIYYWGDIDTHGFDILDKVRSFLPQTKSILMTKEVLLQFRALWVTEDKPFAGNLSHLTDEENRLFCALKDNHWGEHVRLVQERISFECVKMVLDSIQSDASNKSCESKAENQR